MATNYYRQNIASVEMVRKTTSEVKRRKRRATRARVKWVSRRDREQRGREEERGGGEERRSSYTAEVEARATGRERESSQE